MPKKRLPYVSAIVWVGRGSFFADPYFIFLIVFRSFFFVRFLNFSDRQKALFFGLFFYLIHMCVISAAFPRKTAEIIFKT